MSDIIGTIGDVWGSYADGTVWRAILGAPLILQVPIAVILALFAVAALWWGWGRIHETRVSRGWIKTTATASNVLRRAHDQRSGFSVGRDTEGSATYTFDYSYADADGGMHSGSGVSRSDAVKEGEAVVVWVNPDDASASTYVAESELGLSHRFASVLVWAGMLAVVLFFAPLFLGV